MIIYLKVQSMIRFYIKGYLPDWDIGLKYVSFLIVLINISLYHQKQVSISFVKQWNLSRMVFALNFVLSLSENVSSHDIID
jgi:hypothetical protein